MKRVLARPACCWLVLGLVLLPTACGVGDRNLNMSDNGGTGGVNAGGGGTGPDIAVGGNSGSGVGGGGAGGATPATWDEARWDTAVWN